MLCGGETLCINNKLTSANGRYTAKYLQTGYLKIFNGTTKVIWSTVGAPSSNGLYAKLYKNGQFSLYDADTSEPYFGLNPTSSSFCYLELFNSGNLVLLCDGFPTWYAIGNVTGYPSQGNF